MKHYWKSDLVYWKKEYKFNNRNHLPGSLKTYNTILSEELKYLIESPCLFGRKFSNGYINLDILKSIVYSTSKPSDHSICSYES